MIFAIGDIFDITKGKIVSNVFDKPVESSLRYIQIEDLRHDSNVKFTDQTNLVQVDENDIIIAWDGANAGTTGFGLNGIIGSTLTRLSFKETFRHVCNSKYLGYFLDSKFEYFQNTSVGATVPHISRFALESLEVNVPDLETQNKIVAILDKGKALLDKREQTIAKYDELLRATFLEMFGNPMERPNRWKVEPIKNCIIKITAGTSYRGQDKKKLQVDELGVLKISAVTRGIFNPNEFKAVKKGLIRKGVINPSKGDLLFSRANTLEHVGATCIVDDTYENLFLPDKIWKVETNDSLIKSVYLHYALQNKDLRKTFLSIATGSSGSMLNISMDKFKSITIPYPSIELQEQFASKYSKYIELRKKLIDSKHFFSILRNAISQLAFKNELKFGKSIALEVLLENDYKFFSEHSTVQSIKLLLERLDKDELNADKFYEQASYDKAKNFVFELLKEGKVKQMLDEKTRTIKLTI